jgi:hypothetical protein
VVAVDRGGWDMEKGGGGEGGEAVKPPRRPHSAAT